MLALDAHMFTHDGYGPGTNKKDPGPKQSAYHGATLKKMNSWSEDTRKAAQMVRDQAQEHALG